MTYLDGSVTHLNGSIQIADVHQTDVARQHVLAVNQLHLSMAGHRRVSLGASQLSPVYGEVYRTAANVAMA